MYNLNVIYTADTREQLEGFLNDLMEEGLVEKCRADKGCLQYEYYFSAEGENKLLLVESWTDKECQQLHCETAHDARIAEIKPKYNISTKLVVL